MTLIRSLFRQVAYRSGAFGLERLRLRGALTVVMFHRVIDAADPDFVDADPTYTITPELFDDLLGFFGDHYTVVSLADVIGASGPGGVRPLPDYPLLITFDDGWADNLRYAAPLLKSHRLPAVIFAVAGALISPDTTWWHEQVFAAARSGNLVSALGESALAKDLNQMAALSRLDLFDIISRLAAIDQTERDRILRRISKPGAARMMLSPSDLPALTKSRIAIGVHGYTHMPLTHLDDVEGELWLARNTIASLTGDPTSSTALACPHGRYDSRVIRAAHAAGMRVVFTSDPVLNRTADGTLQSVKPIGRISIGTELESPSRRLNVAAAAAWLWRRTCA
jgi:peptidoglycan/xylan/chitin deacetylase (PgdA/CDA1 family)